MRIQMAGVTRQAARGIETPGGRAAPRFRRRHKDRSSRGHDCDGQQRRGSDPCIAQHPDGPAHAAEPTVLMLIGVPSDARSPAPATATPCPLPKSSSVMKMAERRNDLDRQRQQRQRANPRTASAKPTHPCTRPKDKTCPCSEWIRCDVITFVKRSRSAMARRMQPITNHDEVFGCSAWPAQR